MMVPRAPPVIAPPPVFRLDWETLAKVASTQIKPLDLDACPAGFWGPNQETVAVILRPKSRKKLLVLRPKPRNPPPPWFWGSTKKPTADFEEKPGETIDTSFEAKLEKTVTTGFEAKSPETIATSFEAKLEKTVASGFEAKPLETVTIGFEAKPVKTVRVILRPNHSQTVDLGFEAEPRTSRS
jgi:hypothetical protein